jgi:hypothetical protein
MRLHALLFVHQQKHFIRAAAPGFGSTLRMMPPTASETSSLTVPK